MQTLAHSLFLAMGLIFKTTQQTSQPCHQNMFTTLDHYILLKPVQTNETNTDSPVFTLTYAVKYIRYKL